MLARRGRLALVVVTLLLGGWATGQARLEAIDAPGRDLRPGDRIAGTAHVLTPRQPGRFGERLELRMTSGRARGARLLARFGSGARLPPGLFPGSEVRISGALRRPRKADAGFDFRSYLRRRGVAGEVAVATVHATGRRRGGLAGAIDGARVRATSALAAGLGRERAALVRGMVLGQDERIDATVKEDFRDSGLAHVLAVSGQNVMLMAALALPLLAAAGIRGRARMIATIALIAVYVPLAGAGPSLQRAGIMGAASLAALGLARPASRWYALLLAACATLALNPRASADPGWQLSFAAVAGILALAPRLRSGPLRGLPRLLAEAVAITVAATVVTAPLLAHHFSSISLAGLVANVLALPLVAPIMWLGMLRAALGQLLGVEGVALAAALANGLLGAALSPATGALSQLARTFAELPGAKLGLPAFGTPLVLCAYAGIAVATAALVSLARRIGPSLEARSAAWRRRPRSQRALAALAVAAALGLLLARLTAPPAAPRELTVSFLDVGQGDATLIQHPDGTAVLFDGGPPEGRATRLLHRAGVRRLSALVMTHASRDHHGGLREVVDRYPVDLLLDGGDGTRDATFRSIAARAVARGARRIAARAPLRLRAGGLEIHVLSPRSHSPGAAPEDPNARAVVALVTSGGFDLLLSADAESPTLATLRLPRVEAMKVPHHGSRDEGLPAVLRRLRPQLATIPVGENSYGHPAPSTLAALRGADVRTFRTDRHGTVRVSAGGPALRVAVERGDVEGAHGDVEGDP